MRFNRRARLDTSHVRSHRGRGMAVAGGGGIGVLLLVVIAAFMGVDPSQLLGPSGGGAPAGQEDGLEQCRAVTDVEQRAECRFVVYENSIHDFWDVEFSRNNAQYEPATFNEFTGRVSTGCGSATSQTGPFYCPRDMGVYMDLGFFNELQTRFGGRGGDFAEAYVTAHEYGHHVQNLIGQMDRVRTRQGPTSDAVRLELQADCFAGVWAAHATTTPAGEGQPIIAEITDADIAEGINAAQVVGDDYIQERFQGTVTPETWTHGSSEQREAWFKRGLRSGDINRCDTFAADAL